MNAWTTIPMLDRLVNDVMSDVTGTALGNDRSRVEGAFQPAIDVRASEDEFVFECDVPGMKQEDLEITLEGGRLTIKGQRSYHGGQSDKVWLGRSYGRFTRSFTLPNLIDGERLTATLDNGVLTLRLPKLAQAKPRRITIGGDSSKQLAQKG